MSTGLNLFLAVVAVALMAVTAAALAKRPEGAWRYYHFDGSGFSAGPAPDGTPFLAVRDGAYPVVVSSAAGIEATPLPAGKGALAGICFIQRAGGKLGGGGAYATSSAVSVRITGRDGSSDIAGDGNGYFVTALAPGEYEVSAGPARARVVVENGKTTLTALRTGKRMVD